MEDGELVAGRPAGRFIGHDVGRGGNSRSRDGPQHDPLIGAAGHRGGRREGPGDAAGASGARAFAGSRGNGLARIVGVQPGVRAGDQLIEPMEFEPTIGLRGHQVAAAGPRRSGRTESLGQEQHEGRCPESHQSMDADGPDQDRDSVGNEGIATRDPQNIQRNGIRLQGAIRGISPADRGRGGDRRHPCAIGRRRGPNRYPAGRARPSRAMATARMAPAPRC